MAKTQGDHAVKGVLSADGNAKFNKGLDSQYLEVVDQKSRNVAGGTFTGPDATALTWRTRDLTKTNFNDFATSISLASTPGDGGSITLEAGVYYAEISCPAHGVRNHVARLADVTDDAGPAGSTVLEGTTEFAGTPTRHTLFYLGSQTRAHVTGRFQLSAQRTLEIQHRCAITREDDGFGVGSNFYESTNIFTTAKMWEIREGL